MEISQRHPIILLSCLLILITKPIRTGGTPDAFALIYPHSGTHFSPEPFSPAGWHPALLLLKDITETYSVRSVGLAATGAIGGAICAFVKKYAPQWSHLAPALLFPAGISLAMRLCYKIDPDIPNQYVMQILNAVIVSRISGHVERWVLSHIRPTRAITTHTVETQTM